MSFERYINDFVWFSLGNETLSFKGWFTALVESFTTDSSSSRIISRTVAFTSMAYLNNMVFHNWGYSKGNLRPRRKLHLELYLARIGRYDINFINGGSSKNKAEQASWAKNCLISFHRLQSLSEHYSPIFCSFLPIEKIYPTSDNPASVYASIHLQIVITFKTFYDISKRANIVFWIKCFLKLW